MIASALILQADALRLPLPDESVDLIVSSPPYFALRSYRDGDEHYAGQLGSEPTPQAFLEALWAVMHECWRVLKPSGSCFVNLGDKRAGSGGHNNQGISRHGIDSSTLTGAGAPDLARRTAMREATERERTGRRQWQAARNVNDTRDVARETLRATRRNAPDRYNQAAFGRPKSKMLLPHRFAIGCEDGLADPEGKGWIMRSDLVWQKLNGLPESVTDRCRDSHEYLFHLTKEGRYFAAVDEVREPRNGSHDPGQRAGNWLSGQGVTHRYVASNPADYNPLGKLPGSVWPLPSEPLIISDEVKAHYDLPDHFAAFPTELVRRVILGWSPSGICVECGEGRRPVVAKSLRAEDRGDIGSRGEKFDPLNRISNTVRVRPVPAYGSTEATITGYVCACTPSTEHPERRRTTSTPKREDLTHRPAEERRGSNTMPAPGPPVREFHLDGWVAPPTRPAVVLDIFGGTGTTAGVARALGRTGISVDLSHDYSRLARWRIERSGHFAKVVNRTNRENQSTLFFDQNRNANGVVTPVEKAAADA